MANLYIKKIWGAWQTLFWPVFLPDMHPPIFGIRFYRWKIFLLWANQNNFYTRERITIFQLHLIETSITNAKTLSTVIFGNKEDLARLSGIRSVWWCQHRVDFLVSVIYGQTALIDVKPLQRDWSRSLVLWYNLRCFYYQNDHYENVAANMKFTGARMLFPFDVTEICFICYKSNGLVSSFMWLYCKPGRY